MDGNTSTISVPMPTRLFVRLIEFLRDQGSDRDPVEAVAGAVDYWIDNVSWKQEDLMPEIFDRQKGYRWKALFLPHGTIMRMKYKGEFHYAKVDGDRIVFQGRPVSPSEFANGLTGTSRNAWRDIEVRRPADERWHLADSLRPRAEPPSLEDL
jgi:hypothetical protein